jgi:DNA-binding NarL/FixJ family response regulator
MSEAAARPILICDTQPVAVEGVRGLLDRCADLRYGGSICSLAAAFELIRSMSPAAVVVDKTLGVQTIIDWLRKLNASGTKTAVVVWGMGINESEALRLLQAGARGVLRRTSHPDLLITCLRSVVNGVTWLEDGIFGETEKRTDAPRAHLTRRENEIVQLVEKGLRNRDIAKTLGIQTGTVKIHLRHIFEKTGVRGRYGLALNGLREKGMIALPTM